jgi:hypothetical protein
MISTKEQKSFVFSISTRCEDENHCQIPINCVKSIRTFYPDADIFVVDSNSPIKNHIEPLKEMGCLISDLKNINYESGAMWDTYNKIEKDSYVFLQDSILLLGNIDDYINEELSIFGRIYPNWIYCGQHHIDWVNENMLKTDYPPIKEDFNIVEWNSFIVSRKILNKFKDKNLDKILPTNKIGSCGMERILGIALNFEGYTISEDIRIPENLYKKTFTYRQ